jgi:hypothetical protein
MSRKASDEFTVPRCRGHHREIHRTGDEATWWKSAGIDALGIARALWVETHPLRSGRESGASTALDPIEKRTSSMGRSVGGAFLWPEGGGMFFEQYPILDPLCMIGVFVVAWCLATIVMAFLGYCIHNGLWWTKARQFALNGTPAPRLEVDGDEKAPAMPPAPRLEVGGDEKALGSTASSDDPSLSSDRKPDPPDPRTWRLALAGPSGS